MTDRELDLKLTQALETPPQLSIPPGFAARMAALAPAAASVAPAGVSAPRFAMWAVRVSLAILLLTMLFFAPRAVGSSVVPLTLEIALAAEFALLSLWISLRPGLTR
jgi:hypothetical protein